MEKILQKDALWQGKQIKAGEISSPELLEKYFKQIEVLEEKLHSLTGWDIESAREDAYKIQKRIESGQLRHPLAGTIALAKDNICTKRLATECCSKMLKDFMAGYDAHVITCLKEAGVIILGKTNMDEFAMGNSTKTSIYGPTNNPWDTSRIPGGSSGGSCAAVAAHMASFALGSDTGGSIRQPAAHCGVVGLKPTYGRVSRYGLVAYASSMDQIGPVSRSVRDCASILECIGSRDKRDAGWVDKGDLSYENHLYESIQGMRVGIPKEFLEAALDDEIREGILEIAKVLKENGAFVDVFSMGNIDTIIPAYYIFATTEASSNLARYDGVKYGYRDGQASSLHAMYKSSRSKGFGEEVKKRLAVGNFALSREYYHAYYEKAVLARNMLKKNFSDAFLNYQILLTPVTPHLPARWEDAFLNEKDEYLEDICTAGVNLAGLPAMSLPYKLSKKGLPMACQLIGNYFQEGEIFRIGNYLEKIWGHLTCPL